MKSRTTLNNLKAIHSDHRFATMVTLNDTKQMARYCELSLDMFEELRVVCIKADADRQSLNPKSIITWLDANFPSTEPQDAKS